MPQAVAEPESIRSYVDRERGVDAGEELEERLIDAFERIADLPGLDHLRPDLNSRPYYFHPIEPYLIVYLRGCAPLPILPVFHSARNIKRLLRLRKVSHT